MATIYTTQDLVDCDPAKYKKYYFMGITEKVLVIPSDPDWTKILSKIQSCKERGLTLRLITSVQLPKEIIWKASYNENNIIHININMLHIENFSWVSQAVRITEKCGILSLLFMYPIVPHVVKTYQVLQIVESVESCLHCELRLKFLELNPEDVSLEEKENLIKVEDMTLDEHTWKCDPEFINIYMKYLTFYIKIKKSNLNIF